MKITIITACFNNEATINDTLQSVVDQSHQHIEHLIVDGGSTDRTLEIVRSYEHVSKVLSEPDKGIYDALNKGLSMATGDVIGFLHSDDYFESQDVLAKINQEFDKEESLDCVFGDIRFIKKDGSTLRYYSSARWTPNKFKFGLMPAHTSFFARKHVYEQDRFDLNYSIAGDFEHLIRVLHIRKRRYKYLPIVTTAMRPGGASTDGVKSNLTINKEILEACKFHGIRTNYALIYSKYFRKVFEFTRK
jgi:glycosyltransferase involved in cell wall biosynthesis